MSSETRATWTAAYVDTLPDSAFLYVEDGGQKDSEGKTTPRSLRHFPYKDAGGSVDLPHLRNALARIPDSSVPADVKARLTSEAQRLLQAHDGGRSREEFRAQPLAVEIREGEAGERVMVLDLIRFNEWTEINSRAEGNFMERIAPGAATKTLNENRDAMRVLFNHGKDPQIGDKPLGPIRDVYADDEAVRAVVPLLDTTYNRDIEEMLRADPPVLGASFRFQAVREDRKRRPGKSDYNPRGLDERTVQEIRMSEFGPVTFPAYAGTSAGMRSLTDRMLTGRDEPEVAEAPALEIVLDFVGRYLGEGNENILTAVEAALTKTADVPEDGPAQDIPDADEASKTGRSDDGGDVAGDAPPADRAGQYDHPVQGRREPEPLYSGKKETPSWRL